MKERCDLCKWFEPRDATGHDGECRRRSPIAVQTPRHVTSNPAHGVYRVEDWNTRARWPQVEAHDGCGDWEGKQ